ncbi:RING/U-box protein [Euphorbia peplus]|nr:RING/U-box protein [Euphorbia peplus]
MRKGVDFLEDYEAKVVGMGEINLHYHVLDMGFVGFFELFIGYRRCDMMMELDFDALDPETMEFQDNININNNTNNDNSNLEGERCGICMDIIIDRGVLDCCQHWFCFDCIDNWATITNLCPLCQNEFQLITCVPVYDTVGNNQIDDDSSSRDDEWSIEGNNNTLSFPSYYIDENAVICLDGDECKIRSGLVHIEDDSNLDTSIACDSCDIWYHAFCVGFDTEDTSEDTWLCPRCIVGEIPQKSDATSSHLSGVDSGHTSCLLEATFCGNLSVAVADDGETAMVVSMVDGSKENKEATDEDLKVDGDSRRETVFSSKKTCVEAVLDEQVLQISLSNNTSSSQPSASLMISELKTNSVDGEINPLSSSDDVKSSLKKLLNESETVDRAKDIGTGQQGTQDVPQKMLSEEYLLRDEMILPDADKEAAEKTGLKRSRTNRSVDVPKTAADEEDSIKNEAATSQKKLRTKGKFQTTRSKDQNNGFFKDDSRRRTTSVGVPKDAKLKKSTQKEDAVPDIMSIVQGMGRGSSKGLLTQNSGDKSSKERESTAGLRVKKIMRRATEVESSDAVQELRKEIREAVRNRSSTDIGENLFDPKLLAAFRTAVAGSTGEVRAKLPPPDLKAKKLLLQKGKVRENLTKKIYGNSNGRRKRAWDRECEVEFWKHRCTKASKPEKIATLKSVLTLLRKNHEGSEEQESECQAKNPILSRLYLADTSVFPRKNDVKPLSAHAVTNNSEQNSRELNSIGTQQNPSRVIRASELTETNTVSLKLAVPSVNNKGSNDKVLSSKGKATTSREHPDKVHHGSSQSSLGGSKVNSQKGTGIQSDDKKIDKRKWAMEVLARKKAATGTKAMLEKEEDNAMLKGNYPLLAQLPIDMRPVLGQSRHNKIPLSVRQTQVYRLTEHFLRKANLPEIRRTAETELAVADAINIEKGVADRSSSKLVYLNLCSQELLHRSENSAPLATAESNSSSSLQPVDQSEQANEELSSDAAIHDALINAGLISDSPPSSPHNTEKANEVVNSPQQNKEDEPDNIFEIDSHPEEDIYGDFEYDIEDEDYIGAAAVKVAKVPLEESESRLKVVFSTLKSESLTDKDQKKSDDIEETKLSMEGHTDMCTISSTTEDGTDKPSAAPQLLPTEDGEELSLADCEELYGPDKEPLLHNLPEETCELVVHANVQTEENVSSGVNRENSSNCSHTSENVRSKDKSNTRDSTNSVSKKVEMYIKEHIRPLCKTGIITAEQYRWAVAKTAEKVMKFHQNAKSASFLIKEVA